MAEQGCFPSECSSTLLLHADIIFIVPFWMAAIHQPVARKGRRRFVGTLAAHLNSSTLKTVNNWRVDEEFYQSDPWRLRWLVGSRLIADTEAQGPFAANLSQLLEATGYEGKIEICVQRSSALRYEEFGLGTLEYSFRLQLVEGVPTETWFVFLTDRAFWDGIDMVTPIEGGHLPVQAEWPSIRSEIAAAIDQLGKRFSFLEKFLGPRQETERNQRAREDDISWTYCYHVFLYRKSDVSICSEVEWRRMKKFVKDVANLVDITSPQYAKIHVPKLRFDYGSLDILYTGFSFVALLVDPEKQDGLVPISAYVRALLRQMHMNYAAITDASHLLQETIARTLRKEAQDDAETDAESHERLRQVVAALAMIRYRSMRTNFEADDLEVSVYGAAADAWGMEGVTSALTVALDDADRATSRLNEAKRQDDDRRLNYLICFLALLTAIGVLQEFTSFVSGEAPKQWDMGEALFRLVVVLGIAYLGLRLISRFFLLPSSDVHELFRRFSEMFKGSK